MEGNKSAIITIIHVTSPQQLKNSTHPVKSDKVGGGNLDIDIVIESEILVGGGAVLVTKSDKWEGV